VATRLAGAFATYVSCEAPSSRSMKEP
jgi:hypothetical protein